MLCCCSAGKRGCCPRRDAHVRLLEEARPILRGNLEGAVEMGLEAVPGGNPANAQGELIKRKT